MTTKRGSRRVPRAPSARAELFATTPGTWWLAAALACAAVLVYWNSLSVPFTFDDQVSIVDNPQIRRLWPLWDALSPPAGGWPVSGRPLVNLSFALNYAWGGLHVQGYHAVNVTLHVLCTLLLFGIVRRALEALRPAALARAEGPTVPARRSAAIGEAAVGLSFAVALLWTLHPLQTETIDYVSKRTELMMSAFYLITLYGSIRAEASNHPRAWLTASVLACAMGMACKESMVTAPLMVAVYDVTFVFGSVREALRRRAYFYGALAATWLLLGALIWSGPRADTAGFTSRLTSWTYLLNESKMIVRYLSLAFWPRALVLDYGEPLPISLGVALPYAAVVVLLLLLTAAAIARYRTLGFLGVWFFLILAPTSSFVPIATEAGAESRMYLPLAAVVCLMVFGGYLLGRRPVGARADADARRRNARGAWVGVMALSLVCAILGAGTIRRNEEYESPVTLWRTVVERWPHARAHRNLADALTKEGRHEEALAHLREAVRDRPEARYALGRVLFDEGRAGEAIVELRQAIAERPEDPDAVSARVLLGRALASQGNRAEAAQQFRLALRSVPSDVVARGGLADALFAEGDFAAAATEYREYLKSRSDNAAAWQYLGVALFRAGEKEGAAQALGRAVELAPRDGQIQRNLASVLLALDDLDGAMEHSKESVSLLPADAAAHTVLGVALVRRRRFDEAIDQFRQSLRLEPAGNDAREYLSSALTARAAGAGP